MCENAITAHYRNQIVTIQIMNSIDFALDLLKCDNRKHALIIDEQVFRHYQPLFQDLDMPYICVLANENNKSLATITKLTDWLIGLDFPTDGLLVGIGGGVITDLTGFLAQIYHRGIDFWLLPTTLLAMADASVGGKNGCNLKNVKNVLGTVYHPEQIVIALDFLKTLPKTRFSDGYAEIIKIAALRDAAFFETLAQTTMPISDIVYRAISLKTQICECDEFSQNERHALNFGHTLGHAYESASGFQLSHGVAISWGMINECQNLIVKDKLITVLKKYQLLDHEINIKKEDLIAYFRKDKKIQNGSIRLVNVDEIGHYELVSKPLNQLLA